MKLLIIAIALGSAMTVHADSNSVLRSCLSKTYSAALKIGNDVKANDVIKFVNKDIKACKDEVKSIVKAEKDAKRREKLEAQIKKLQVKLVSGK